MAVVQEAIRRWARIRRCPVGRVRRQLRLLPPQPLPLPPHRLLRLSHRLLRLSHRLLRLLHRHRSSI